MTRKKNAAPESGPVGEREIVVARDFDAPRELVYAAFVDPKHVPAWWGPRGFTLEPSTIDVRVGGMWRFVLRGPDGHAWPNCIVYRELSAPARIVYDHGADADDPARFHVTITFDALEGGRTRVTMRTLFSTAAQRDGVLKFDAVALGKSTLDRGAAHIDRSLFVETVPGQPVAMMRRLLHAPRPLVWEAMTRPEHVAQWYGPRSTQMSEAKIDLRVGGAYRFVMKGQDGNTHAFSGTYREIVPEERIVQTWCWEGAPDAAAVESMRLIDLGDRTLVEVSTEHSSMLNLEMHVKHGMEKGANETYQRLDELLPVIEGAPTELVIERTLDAPRALVFAAWTDPKHFRQWFGPHGVEMPTCELDARPGGAIRFCHRFQDGAPMWLAGRFETVEANARIVFTLMFVDERGERIPCAPVPDLPVDAYLETTVTWTDAADGKTRQVVRQTILPEAARHTAGARSHCAMAREGWKQTLDQLERFVHPSH